MSRAIIEAAVSVALAPPQHRAKSRKAYVPWEHIEALRVALLDAGYFSLTVESWLERGAERLENGLKPEEFKQ